MSHWSNNRRLEKARTLLRPAVEEAAGVWADLGCGDGVFTYWLATFLKAGSHLYAIDKEPYQLKSLQHNFSQLELKVSIEPRLADFTQPLTLPPLDGLVLANSLHFVRQKEPVLRRLVGLLKSGGRLVLVEYNTNCGNCAVPYPLAEAEFLPLARTAGLREARIVTRAPSTFLGEMYTGVALK
jgi:ubiquinone/menaquinone biosynthesis C-methylase UbiE